VDHEGGIVAYPNPPAPAERTRPTTVRVSSYLLYVVAAIQLISAVIQLSQVGTTSRVLRDAYAGTAAEGAEAVIAVVGVATAVFSILFAAGLTILAIFNDRGRQGSRVTTWVIGGLALCCNGFAVLGNAAARSMNLDTGNNAGPSSAEVERQLNAALPSWYNGVTITLAVISLLCLLGAIVLLALPASNACFRRARAGGFDPAYGLQPPYPGGPYGAGPGQPGYPPYPAPYGAPPPGQPPYGPPVPGPGGPGQPPSGMPTPPSDPWSAPPPPPPSVPPSPPGPGSEGSPASPWSPGSPGSGPGSPGSGPGSPGSGPGSPGSSGAQRPPSDPTSGV
jgi:hypothetical protein